MVQIGEQRLYGFKTLIDLDTDQISGAHLVGPHAEEVINLFGIAIRSWSHDE
jgi:glutathione reductase (NADPH)